MKRKIICVGIIGMFLLISFTAISVGKTTTNVSDSFEDEDKITVEIYVRNKKDETPIKRALVSVIYATGINYELYQNRTDRNGYCKLEIEEKNRLFQAITIQANKIGYYPEQKIINPHTPGVSYDIDLDLKKIGSSLSKQFNLFSLFKEFPLIQRLLLF